MCANVRPTFYMSRLMVTVTAEACLTYCMCRGLDTWLKNRKAINIWPFMSVNPISSLTHIVM